MIWEERDKWIIKKINQNLYYAYDDNITDDVFFATHFEDEKKANECAKYYDLKNYELIKITFTTTAIFDK